MTILVFAIRFLCEIALVVALAWWGWPLLGIVLAVLVIAVWGVWFAPKAARRLPDPLRLVLELVLFALATAAYWDLGHPVLAVVFAVAAVTTALLARRLPQP